MRAATFRERGFWLGAALGTLFIELVTIVTRIAVGQSGAEFNAQKHPPLWVQVHHPVYAVPLILVGVFVKRPWPSRVLWALAFALIASDAIHHLIVLPLWVGNMGWHWP